MKVWFVTPEAVPLAKTGGLGDVCGALPSALEKLGANVSVVMPWYSSIDGKKIDSLSLSLGSENFTVIMGKTQLSGVDVHLVGYPPYYHRQELYGEGNSAYPDNDRRFMLLSRAAIAWGMKTGMPDLFHCHDWFTAMVPMYLNTDSTVPHRPSVFTVHNLQYQGVFPASSYGLTGLSWDRFNPAEVEYYGQLNLMKTGLVYADKITTVSPTYSREIQTSKFGEGLENILRRRSSNLEGILNGIDDEIWNPQKDVYLEKSEKFSRSDLSGKKKLKETLLETYSLESDEEEPLIGMVSRLAGQKGIDLLLESSDELMKLPGNWLILGTGEKRLEAGLKKWEEKYPERVRVILDFNEKIAHRIVAGSDIYCMPSRFEPCGLNQMYSFQYGTVPVVHSTGGLADTVEDGETGFVFDTYLSDNLIECFKRAINTCREEPEGWNGMVKLGMEKDFSWKNSAAKYYDLYRRLLEE